MSCWHTRISSSMLAVSSQDPRIALHQQRWQAARLEHLSWMVADGGLGLFFKVYGHMKLFECIREGIEDQLQVLFRGRHQGVVCTLQIYVHGALCPGAVDVY